MDVPTLSDEVKFRSTLTTLIPPIHPFTTRNGIRNHDRDEDEDEDSSVSDDLGDIIHEEDDNDIIAHSEVEPDTTRPSYANNRFKRTAAVAFNGEWDSTSEDEPARPKRASGARPVPTNTRNKSLQNKRPLNASAARSTKTTTKTKTRQSEKKVSMSKTAVDFRKRKQAEADLCEKVCVLIDDDILEAVEEEGGITPPGRMYKAVLRMMQRMGYGEGEEGKRKGNEQAKAKVKAQGAGKSQSGGDDEVARLRAENGALREAVTAARELLGSVLEY